MEMVEPNVESLFLQSSCRWVDIVLLVDGIRTLVDVVIVDLAQGDLVSWVATSLAVQVKKRLVVT
jgi:hypothetical protein